MKGHRFSTQVLLNFLFTILVAVMLCSCGSGSDDKSPPKKSSEKQITRFQVDGIDSIINETEKKITVTVPIGNKRISGYDSNNIETYQFLYTIIETTGVCVSRHNYQYTDPTTRDCMVPGHDPTSQIGLRCRIDVNPCIYNIYSHAEDGSSELYNLEIYFDDNSGDDSNNDDDSGDNIDGNAGIDPGGTGDISMTLTWSWSGSSETEGPDIDMWVTDPNGHRLTTSRDDYSLGPCPCGGQIDFDDLGGWGPGDGGGPERAFWPTGSAPSGTYTYGVRYYQGDGTANYTLKVYKGTALQTTKTGTSMIRIVKRKTEISPDQ
ncbi:MAG TPA: hypothetical protein PLV50_08645, partial [Smithella sp.]|nr:hypothetical protein [Smithella sp.]HOG90593.1 hypothetical protein [Smithella sp.]